MATSDPLRSAAPLAAAGIICLGLVPTLGGPEQPLHWTVTGGMVGFGVLLWLRHGLRKRAGALRPVPEAAARLAGRALLVICGIVGVLLAVIVGSRWAHGGSIGLLSLAMPLAGLAWLVTLALQTRRHREPAADALPANDRPSRRPPAWDALSKPKPSDGSPSNRHVSI